MNNEGIAYGRPGSYASIDGVVLTDNVERTNDLFCQDCITKLFVVENVETSSATDAIVNKSPDPSGTIFAGDRSPPNSDTLSFYPNKPIFESDTEGYMNSESDMGDSEEIAFTGPVSLGLEDPTFAGGHTNGGSLYYGPDSQLPGNGAHVTGVGAAGVSHLEGCESHSEVAWDHQPDWEG